MLRNWSLVTQRVISNMLRCTRACLYGVCGRVPAPSFYLHLSRYVIVSAIKIQEVFFGKEPRLELPTPEAWLCESLGVFSHTIPVCAEGAGGHPITLTLFL